jgi:hypothetical protein
MQQGEGGWCGSWGLLPSPGQLLLLCTCAGSWCSCRGLCCEKMCWVPCQLIVSVPAISKVM